MTGCSGRIGTFLKKPQLSTYRLEDLEDSGAVHKILKIKTDKLSACICISPESGQLAILRLRLRHSFQFVGID